MTETIANITLADLQKLSGYVEEHIKSPYEIKRLRNQDHLLILYTTGKLVIQGKNNPFRSEKIPENISLQESIGSDETLKGDTFGGIIVCGSYFKQGEVEVKDSKTYTDDQIIILAKQLLENYSSRFFPKILTPAQYNSFYAELGSQTAILNALHREVGIELKKQFSVLQVVDQYPGCTVGDVQEAKAESKHTSVAAASIIARYYAILQFNELSERAGFILPKGSTHVKEAVAKMRKLKLPIDEFCKIHFSTITRR